MLIKLVVIIFLICASTLSSAEEGSIPNKSLWHALEPLGAEKQLKSEKIQQAFYEFGIFFQSMDAWRASFYLPHLAQPNWFAFREDIQEHSIKEFISLKRTYKHKAQNSALSSILFEGRWPDAQESESSRFDFSIIESDSIKPNKLTSKSQFGEISAQLRLSEGSLKENNTRVDLQATMALESMIFTEMLECIEAINQLFEQKYMNRENAESRMRDASLQTGHNMSHLSPFEKQLFANLYSSLPHTITTLTRFSTFEKLAQPTLSPSGQQATMITHQQKINLEEFSKAFPDTYQDFNFLLNRLSIHTKVLTHDDKKIGEFRYDANTQQISANFALANGGFMLQNRNDELLDEIIFPSQLDTLKYKIITQAKISILGLDFDISNIDVQAHYQAGKGHPRWNRTAKIDMQMTSLPDIEVHGALLYIIPYWLIDLLIPGSLETLIIDAFVDVVSGNNGQGFSFDVEFIEKDNNQQIAVNTAIEMPHQLLQAILKIEEPELTKQPRLYQSLRNNLREDFARTAAPYKDPRLSDYLTPFLD